MTSRVSTMKKTFAAIALCVASVSAVFAIETTAWRYRQPFDIAAPGATRVALPLETLDRLQPDLRDLRIIDGGGAELPYAVLELPSARAAYKNIVTTRRPVSLQIDGEKKEIIATIATETDAPLDSVELSVADTSDYMLPARVEISGDGSTWSTLARGQAIFRRNQGGRYNAVVQNTLALNGSRAAFVRVAISADESTLAITGAEVRSIKETAARESEPDIAVPARIVSAGQREGETLLTIDLGAANLSLRTLSFQISDALFMRSVSVIDADNNTLVRNQALYGVQLRGEATARKTTLEFRGLFVPTRRVTVRIENGDSPPLDVRGAGATCRPVHIAFNPAAAGRHVFLSGNSQARAPRYDLAVLSDKLASLPLSKISAAAQIETPDYRAPEPPREPSQWADNALFWIALAAVVIVLLVVVAKLLPRAKE